MNCGRFGRCLHKKTTIGKKNIREELKKIHSKVKYQQKYTLE